MSSHPWSRDPVAQAAVRRAEDGRTDPVPTLDELFAAVPWRTTPEPHGWLTAEERRLIEMEAKAQRDPFDITGTSQYNAAVLRSLLARSTPPLVERPMPWHFHTDEAEDEKNQAARDRQWIAAIREAGVEVAE